MSKTAARKTCDLCGTPARHRYAVRVTSGKRSRVAMVGSSCARKFPRARTSDLIRSLYSSPDHAIDEIDQTERDQAGFDPGPHRYKGLKLVPAKIFIATYDRRGVGVGRGEFAEILVHVGPPTGKSWVSRDRSVNYFFKKVSKQEATHPIQKYIRGEILKRLPSYLSTVIAKQIVEGASFAVLDDVASRVYSPTPIKEKVVIFGQKAPIELTVTPTTKDSADVSKFGTRYLLRSVLVEDSAPIISNLKETEAKTISIKYAQQLNDMGVYAVYSTPSWNIIRERDKELERVGSVWADRLSQGFVPERPINPLWAAWTDPGFAKRMVAGGKFYYASEIAGAVPPKHFVSSEDGSFTRLSGGEFNMGFLVVGPTIPNAKWEYYVTRGLWLAKPDLYEGVRALTILDVKGLGYAPDPSDIDRGTQIIVKIDGKKYEVVRPEDILSESPGSYDWQYVKDGSGNYNLMWRGHIKPPDQVGQSDKASNRAHLNRSAPRGYEKLQDRLGMCFMLSAKYVTTNEDSELVHGSIQGYSNPRIDHAWVEEGTAVYDAVLDKWVPRREYYRRFNAEPETRYSQTEVLKLLLRHKHWGPWPLPKPK